MWLIDKIAEQRIAESMKKGEFSDLPGQGKPIILEDDSHIPESLRVGYRILKNAGYIPPELQARKELVNLRQLLDTVDVHDGIQRDKITQRINYLLTRIGASGSENGSAITQDAYYKKLQAHLQRRKTP